MKENLNPDRVKRIIKFSLFDLVNFNFSKKQNSLKREHYVMIILKL